MKFPSGSSKSTNEPVSRVTTSEAPAHSEVWLLNSAFCVCFGKQRSKDRRAPAEPQQPNTSPQRMRRARNRRNMTLLFQRRQDLERAQASARYQNCVSVRLRL